MNITNTFVLVLGLVLQLAVAQANVGTRGGGNTVDYSGRPVLRDLVETTNCDWYSGKEFLKKISYFDTAIRGLKKTHVYFADTLNDEAAALKFCLTRGRLLQVPTEDQVSVTVYRTEPRAQQAAIRLNDSVYIDANILNSLDEINKAYLIIHEAMHSFIPLDAERRNHKLRSIVSAIRSNETNQMSAERFGLHMTQSSISFPVPSLALQKNYSTFKKLQNLVNNTPDTTSWATAKDLLRHLDGVSAEDLNGSDKDILSTDLPIRLAIKADEPSAVLYLIDSGNQKASTIPTLFIWTVTSTSSGNALIALGSRFPAGYDISSGNPMFVAAIAGNTPIVHGLLALGSVRVNWPFDGYDHESPCRRFGLPASVSNAIRCAATLGHTDTALELAKDPRVDVTALTYSNTLGHSNYLSVLGIAIYSKNYALVEGLLNLSRSNIQQVCQGFNLSGTGKHESMGALEFAEWLDANLLGYRPIVNLIRSRQNQK